jgi:hypothetical protein
MEKGRVSPKHKHLHRVSIGLSRMLFWATATTWSRNPKFSIPIELATIHGRRAVVYRKRWMLALATSYNDIERGSPPSSSVGVIGHLLSNFRKTQPLIDVSSSKSVVTVELGC